MSSSLAPFSKADFDYLWKSGPPNPQVYGLIRRLLEGRLVQLLKDASRRVESPDKIIRVHHLTPSVRRAPDLYFVEKG